MIPLPNSTYFLVLTSTIVIAVIGGLQLIHRYETSLASAVAYLAGVPPL